MSRLELKIGDFIRNKKPYWGEPAYKVVSLSDLKNGYVNMIPTGSKHGPGWNYPGSTNQILWGEAQLWYLQCGKLMRVWLWILGNTYGKILKSA